MNEQIIYSTKIWKDYFIRQKTLHFIKRLNHKKFDILWSFDEKENYNIIFKQ